MINGNEIQTPPASNWIHHKALVLRWGHSSETLPRSEFITIETHQGVDAAG